MSAHHAMERRRSDHGREFWVGSLHYALYATPNVNRWHCESHYRREQRCRRVHHTCSVSYSDEGEHTVRKLVVFEPVHKKFRCDGLMPAISHYSPPYFVGAHIAHERHASTARELCTSVLSYHPQLYGLPVFHFGNFATGARP